MVLQNGVLPVVSHWAREIIQGAPYKLHYHLYREGRSKIEEMIVTHCNQKGAKLKEYETDPKCLLLSQNLTTISLLICVLYKLWTWNCSASSAYQNINNFAFATCRKHVNQQRIDQQKLAMDLSCITFSCKVKKI